MPEEALVGLNGAQSGHRFAIIARMSPNSNATTSER
jgi:hypothetical protein